MEKHYSAYFKRSHKEFVAKGVFNGFVGKDARLHVDPLLLKRCKTPEFVGAYDKLLDHFRKLVTLVPERDKPITDLRYKSIVKHLSFPEFYYIGLGFGEESNAGTGITGKKAELLADTAIEIIQDGIEDPEIFLLVNLFQEKIGADGISDIMIWTLRDEFIKYTQRITKEFGFKTHKFGVDIDLPFFYQSRKNKLVATPIIFVPTEIIRDLPEADYIDGHFFSNYNNEIRRRISFDVGLAMKDMQNKKLLKQRLLAKPAVLSKMAEIYRHLEGKSYDFIQDDNFIYASAVIAELIGQESLPLKAKEDNLEAVLYIARQICLQFKKMVETNRMSELLYNNDKFKNEKAVQRLFLIMADGYCKISDIVLSPETDYGVGPVDFKFSSGYHSKVLLEMKLASNSQLMHGIEVQLPTYLKAESTSKGIYMIVIANEHDEKLVNLFWQKIKAQNIPESLMQNIIVIDARKHNSASRL